jgi:O-antigen/teichoic acid export membrane protein
LSLSDAGVFFWLLSFTTVLLQFGTQGYHDVILKDASQKKNNPQQLLTNSKFIFHQVLKGSFIVTVIGLLSYSLLQKSIPKLESLNFVSYTAMTFTAFLWCFTNLTGHLLQGLNKKILSIYTISIATPIIFCFFYLFLLKVELTLTHTCVLFLVAQLINTITSYFFIKKFLHKTDLSPEAEHLNKMSKEIWAISIMSVALNWGAQLISGIWISPEKIAGLSVCIRISLALNFILIAINFILAPKIANLSRENKNKELQITISSFMNYTYFMLIPLIFFLAFFKKNILNLFGNDYINFDTVLIILIFGQVINVLTGPAGYLLTMSGNEKSMKHIYIISTLTTLIGIFIMTPIYGVLGAAISTTLGICTQNLGATYLVKKKVGISIIPSFRPYLKALTNK